MVLKYITDKRTHDLGEIGILYLLETDFEEIQQDNCPEITACLFQAAYAGEEGSGVFPLVI